MKKILLSIAATLSLVALAPATAQAASVSVTPASSTVNLSQGTFSFSLLMDFSAEATLGGGIDIDVEGPISFLGFTPSAYFSTAGDPAFSGYGTLRADKDFEVHIGNFAGLSGVNSLGTITVNLNGTGTGTVSLAANTYWGGFYSLAGNAQAVTMTPASLTVTAAVVPEPASTALLLAGAAALALRLNRVRAAA